jgi:hypothetical protein
MLTVQESDDIVINVDTMPSRQAAPPHTVKRQIKSPTAPDRSRGFQTTGREATSKNMQKEVAPAKTNN